MLGIDPGSRAGASIFIKGQLIASCAVVTNTRALEAFIDRAIEEAARVELPLIVLIEEWGRGGPRGIEQWIGLGGALGAWRRALELARVEHPNGAVLGKGKIARIMMSRWRSKMISETGERDALGKFKTFDAEGWKKAATRTCARLYPQLTLDSSDQAEAILIGDYGARGDEVGALLSAKHLAKHGFEVVVKKT